VDDGNLRLGHRTSPLRIIVRAAARVFAVSHSSHGP
jgi:hypothetical protein